MDSPRPNPAAGPGGLSRRTVLKVLGGGVAGTLLGIPTPAAAFPALLALEAAGAVLQLVGAFTRSDGGLGALLAADYQMSQLISDQLTKISRQLAALQLEVSRLRADIRQELIRQAQDQLVTSIRTDAQAFAEFLSAAAGDPMIWSNIPERRRLAEIDSRVENNRRLLANSSTSYGPDAAMVLPVACSLEIAIKPRIDFRPSTVRETLLSYLGWVDKLLGGGSDSIPDYLKDAAGKHDAAVAECAATNPLGKRMGIENFALSGSQQGEGADWCLIVGGSPRFTGGPSTYPAAALDHARRLPGYYNVFRGQSSSFGYLYSVRGSIRSVPNEQLHFAELSYASGGVFRQVPPDPPPADGAANCVYTSRDGGADPASSILPGLASLAARTDAPSFEDALRDKLRGTLEEMNYQRGRIVYGVQAQAVALEARGQIRRWLEGTA